MSTGFVPQRGAALGTPTRPSTKVVGIPAPVSGINAVDPVANVPPEFCLSAINFIADGRTMLVRPGYQQFATSVGDGHGVRTVMPFIGATSSPNKLWAVCREGIYDITSGGAIGAASIALSAGTTTGYGVWSNFVLDNGAHYLFYADPTDGLFQYPSGGPWAQVTAITGVAETSLVFVMQFKGRLWFIEKDSARGWYLASGAVAGAATRFDFGNKFIHGGNLVGLYSWTVDGGEGVDDHLVAISSTGDVMVYKGDDPSSAATWTLVGQYYVGIVPTGFRVAAQQGGDLYLLSQYGVIPLTRLMRGVLVQEEQAQLSRNIAPLIADTMDSTRQSIGWEMKNVPDYNVFLVATPAVASETELQFCLSTRTQGWTLWNDLPYLTGEVYGGDFYFGDSNATVYKLVGGKDAVAAAGTGGIDINFSLLTTFQDYGDVGKYHRAQFIRTVFTVESLPGIAVSARYDYDMSGPPVAESAGAVSSALWDTAVWDVSIWGASTRTVTRTFGASGIGRAVAVSLGGNSNGETGLVRIDLFADGGGPL